MRLQSTHPVVFSGLLAAIFYADPDWVKLMKEKSEICHLRDLSTMPTANVMAKWFKFDARARLSASKLVFIYLSLWHINIWCMQIEDLYEKLKFRLYNTEYRKMKRIEQRYDGDRSKILNELGFDLPFRAKRVRKTKDKTTQDIEAAPTKGDS